ncbi:hypothetical protein CONLIGDRAFT_245988 [Coniochaeta ligniaria NRRL 30616]|uniref:Uncharacterized protein n=1 Tax=Coniochaeta ligniaria NRRL 30616 TaxID=1408157 RepID=A0A1J7IXM7_9PEZI|nr:hypothetical protein CONLIGDRAFT_245988 [Coniochaeta ligniaria NRRL 30616]
MGACALNKRLHEPVIAAELTERQVCPLVRPHANRRTNRTLFLPAHSRTHLATALELYVRLTSYAAYQGTRQDIMIGCLFWPTEDGVCSQTTSSKPMNTMNIARASKQVQVRRDIQIFPSEALGVDQYWTLEYPPSISMPCHHGHVTVIPFSSSHAAFALSKHSTPSLLAQHRAS